MSEHLIEDLAEAKPVMEAFLGGLTPEVGLILGSGLNPFADSLRDARILPFGDVPHMGVSSADGHRGQFVLGRVCEESKGEGDEEDAGTWVLCLQGRLHGYEGFTAQQVAFPVWLMAQLGIKTLITTNAAGAINAGFAVGDFCIMTDQINLTGRNPLAGMQPNQMADRFVPMKDAFNPELVEIAYNVATDLNIPIQKGVYLGTLGPCFETPAEIRAFRVLGADTVAMSVCEEVIAARHFDMRVLGISLCSNMACGVENANPSGDEVMDVAVGREVDFSRLIAGILQSI